MENPNSKFIPNSYQTPNAYVDQLMSVLTGEEWKVLTYAARRIFGFSKRQDRIARSQLTKGLPEKDGGTGLSNDGVSAAVKFLIAANILIKLEDNDPHKNEGPLYALQLDSDAVNWELINQRAAAWEAARQAKNEKLRQAQAAKLPPIYRGTEEPTPIGDPPGSQLPPRLPQAHNIQGNTVKHSERQVSKKRTPAARDPRLDHPAIIAIKAVMRRYPDKAAWDAIIKVLGETPNQKKLEDIFTEWVLRGNKPTNIKGILDWYTTGIPSQKAYIPRPAGPLVERSYWPDGSPVED